MIFAMIAFLPLALLSLPTTLASSVTVYQTSTLTFTVAASTSYLTTPTPASSLSSATSPPNPTSPTTYPSTQEGTAQYISDPTFEAAILNSTNAYRTAYNAPALTWNTTLATYATTYASQCLFTHSHSPYGENIAETYPNVTAAIQSWAHEAAQYDWSSPGFTERTGHFSQLVWAASRNVGCGRVQCDGNSVGGNATGWLLVCEYEPQGNVEGGFGANVGRAKGRCVGSAGGAAGKEALEICEEVSGAEGRGRGGGWWSVVVGGAVWMAVLAVL